MTVIRLRGARQHNLRGLDLDLERERLVVFAGPSGSGKSSLAFDTLYAEGRRRYLDALAGELRGLPARLVPPDFDVLDGLPPTIALDQRLPDPTPRETVASLADLAPVLRVLWARAGVQHCPVTGDPIVVHTHEQVVNALDALPPGTRLTIEAPVKRAGGDLLAEIGRAGFSRVRVGGEVLRLEDVGALPAEATVRVVVDRLKVEPGRRERLHDAVRTAARAGAGVIVAATDAEERVYVDRPYSLRADRELPALTVGLMHSGTAAGWCPACEGLGLLNGRSCPACEGERLREEARAVRLHGLRLPELLGLDARDALAQISGWPALEAVTPAVEELRRRLDLLLQVGLGALPLDRRGTALSSGERQRLRLLRQVGARLSGVLYVLDEPASGLGPEDARGVAAAIRGLVEQGNTAIVVEHHPALIAAADRVIEIGPGPGLEGGRIVYDGPPDGLRDADTPTGRWLSGRAPLPASRRRSGVGALRLSLSERANLRERRFELPVGALVALAGPSGSGKSTLLDAAVEAVTGRIAGNGLPWGVAEAEGALGLARVVQVDRGAMRRSPRSSPATYTGIWDLLRELFAATAEAQVRALDASFFSLNVPGGRCEACKGSGQRVVELQVVADVWMACEVCGGTRFHGDVLQVRWKGRNAHELLSLPASEARALLAGHPKLEVALRALCEVGLGYLPLGQPGHTLSGGEAQRLKLARELARAERGGVEGTLYVLDDPTVGLHPVDVAVLLDLLQRLVDQGATVWLATHDEAVAASADTALRLA